jgi:hypothetical protein
MKKQLLLLSFLLAFGKIDAQIGTIAPSIPTGTFVSGVSPVLNTFTLDTTSIAGTLPSGTNTVRFKLLNGAGTTVLDSIQGTPIANGWSGVIDMGKGDSTSTVFAAYYNIGGTYLDSTSHHIVYITPKPLWMQSSIGGHVDSVISTSNPITMIAHLPVYNSNPPSNSMPSAIPGLGGRPYDLGVVELRTSITYDYTNPTTSTLTNHNLNYNLNVFNQLAIPINYTLPAVTSGITLDQNFNLAFIDSASASIPPKRITFPLASIPTLPVPYIKVDGGFELNASVRGKLVFGYDSNAGKYGFYGNGNDTTQVIAKASIDAFLRVKADALIASASGTLRAVGSIGGGFTYASYRTTPFSPLFGVSLQIAGEIDYQLGPSWWSIAEGHFSKTFYDDIWGNQLRKRNVGQTVCDQVDAMGNYLRVTQTNPYLKVPDFYAQPDMAANDSLLYVVWLDTLVSGTNTKTKILFSKFDYQTQTFSVSDTVRTAESISNPKVAILPSGDALISWSENRYNSSQPFDTSKTMIDLLKAQDIWITLYDKQSNAFAAAQQLSDPLAIPTDLGSGKAEGNANIIMSKDQSGSYGLITWVVNNDTTYKNADVWFCPLAEVGGNNVIIGAPRPLINLPGTNRDVNVAYYDSTHAIASWIFDPDGIDSTKNNKVVYMEWTQTGDTIGTWSVVDTLVSNNGTTFIDDLSTDFNGIYGAIAWTSTEYDANGNFTKRITADAWNNLGWATPKIDTSDFYYFAQPKVSVNKNGVVSLTYQQVQLYDDTLNPDMGQLNLFTCDSKNNATVWNANNGSGVLGDSLVYDWDLNTTYGDSANFYIITQEADAIMNRYFSNFLSYF